MQTSECKTDEKWYVIIDFRYRINGKVHQTIFKTSIEQVYMKRSVFLALDSLLERIPKLKGRNCYISEVHFQSCLITNVKFISFFALARISKSKSKTIRLLTGVQEIPSLITTYLNQDIYRCHICKGSNSRKHRFKNCLHTNCCISCIRDLRICPRCRE